jgi:hypothetical protein
MDLLEEGNATSRKLTGDRFLSRNRLKAKGRRRGSQHYCGTPIGRASVDLFLGPAVSFMAGQSEISHLRHPIPASPNWTHIHSRWRSWCWCWMQSSAAGRRAGKSRCSPACAWGDACAIRWITANSTRRSPRRSAVGASHYGNSLSQSGPTRNVLSPAIGCSNAPSALTISPSTIAVSYHRAALANLHRRNRRRAAVALSAVRAAPDATA